MINFKNNRGNGTIELEAVLFGSMENEALQGMIGKEGVRAEAAINSRWDLDLTAIGPDGSRAGLIGAAGAGWLGVRIEHMIHGLISNFEKFEIAATGVPFLLTVGDRPCGEKGGDRVGIPVAIRIEEGPCTRNLVYVTHNMDKVIPAAKAQP